MTRLHALLFGGSGAAYAPWRIFGAYGWLELAAWITLLAVAGSLVGRVRWIDARRSAVVLLVAAVPRLLVRRIPYNWYLGVSNLHLGSRAFSLETTYMPLLPRVVAFDLGGGSRALWALNIALGLASIALVMRTLRRMGESDAVITVAGVLMAVSPMYVRLSASDTAQMTELFLWACAAAAFAELRNGSRRVATQAAFAASVLAGCPIRNEGAYMMAMIPLFVGGDPRGWAEIVRGWRRYLPCWIALAAGEAIAHAYYFDQVGDVLGKMPHPVVMLIGVVLRTFGVIDLSVTPLLPPVVTIGIASWFLREAKERHWSRLIGAVVVLALSAVPYVASGTTVFSSFSTASYNIVPVVFMLTVAARGFVVMAQRVRDGVLLRSWWKRIAAAAVAAPVAWFCLVPGYRWTFAFQDEFDFLDRNLPQGPATIATIWDIREQAGGYECCLAAPHAIIFADHPRLRWILLTADDVRSGRLDTLSFDYYYPGTLPEIDCEDAHAGMMSRALGSPAWDFYQRWVMDRRHLRTLRALDAEVRRKHEVVPVATTRFATTMSPPFGRGTDGVVFGFPEVVDLALYRAVPGRVAGDHPPGR